MKHTLINVVLPFSRGRVERVEAFLNAKADPTRGNRPNPHIVAALDATGVLHFASVTVVDVVCPAEADLPDSRRPDFDAAAPAHLLIELSSDVACLHALDKLVDVLHQDLTDLLTEAGIGPQLETLQAYLARHHHEISDGWFGTLGQIHCGTPGMTVKRIKQESDLAANAGELIVAARACPQWASLSPRQRLDHIRDALWAEEKWKWAFIAEEAPLLGGAPSDRWSFFNVQLWKAAGTIVWKFLWPLSVLMLAVVFTILVVTSQELDWDLRLLSVAWGMVVFVLPPLIVLGFQYRWTWLLVALLLSFLLMRVPSSWRDQLLWMTWVWGAAIVASLTALGTVFWRLRHVEATDLVEDRMPSPDHVRDLMERENFCAQNSLASVSRLKPGLLRKWALHLVFIVVGAGRFVCAPGFLGKNGVIHFARWMRLRDSGQLLFFSNYDGTWESYVADFIADAPTGVTGIWSNCVGFPRTVGLFSEGASSRDALVRWARRQQNPTRLWYSAYPDLTTARIRVNAAIRQGIASAKSDSDARDWLALFGSAPSAASALQVPNMPTLVFGGLSNMRYATCYVMALSEGVSQCKRWLRVASKNAAYGLALPGQRSAVVIGLSAGGLRRLGLTSETLKTFPVAFQHGMSSPWRARAIGDGGRNAPEHWIWGVPEDSSGIRRADAIVLVYGIEESDVAKAWSEIEKAAIAEGHRVVYRQAMDELPTKRDDAKTRAPNVDAPNGARQAASVGEQGGAVAHGSTPADASTSIALPSPPREAFGFVDGVSQPTIRGAPRSSSRTGKRDLVEPGELVLGYPDNLGRIPLSPSIADGYDPGHLLPDLGSDPFRQRPEFSRYEGDGWRDLGTNGTFLVVRQLEQHWTELERWLDTVVDDIEKGKGEAVISADGDRVAVVWNTEGHENNADVPPIAPRRGNRTSTTDILREFGKEAIAAKLMGRWRDGTSLVRHPQMPGGNDRPPSLPDNAFLPGAEDKSGLACPLGAHIRRANPRDTRFPGAADEIASTNRHRILRVGRSYRNDESTRGLFFMCINVDIERQFEFIQKTWLMNPNIHGLECEVDPILGRTDVSGPKSFTIPTPTGPVKLTGLPDLVTMKGGGYFFLPGRPALHFLSEPSPDD